MPTNTEALKLAQTINSISEMMQALRRDGLNEKAILVLLADHTKLPKKTIKKVLDGLNDLVKQYVNEAYANQDTQV